MKTLKSILSFVVLAVLLAGIFGAAGALDTQRAQGMSIVCEGEPPSPPAYYETSTPGVWQVFEYQCDNGVWVQHEYTVDHRHPTDTPAPTPTATVATETPVPTPEATIPPPPPVQPTAQPTIATQATEVASPTPVSTVVVDITPTTGPGVVEESLEVSPPVTGQPSLQPTPTYIPTVSVGIQPTPTQPAQVNQPAQPTQPVVETPIPTAPAALATPQPCPFEMDENGNCGLG